MLADCAIFCNGATAELPLKYRSAGYSASLLNRGGLDMRDSRSFSFFSRVPDVILRVMKRESLLRLQKRS